MPVTIRPFAGSDAEPAADLFRANTREAVADPAADGFVQGEFPAVAFLRVAGDGGVVVADDGGRLVAVACSGLPHPPSSPSPIGPLYQQVPDLKFEGRPVTDGGWITYGPVVVDAAYRGRGIARRLVAAVRDHWHGRARVALLFIEAGNDRSIAVHLSGLGMSRIGEYPFGGHEYLIVAFAI